MLGHHPISDQPISSLPSAGSSTAYTLTGEAGSFLLTGQDATFVIGRVITADAGSFTLTGQDATLSVGRVITADAGVFTLTGQDATLTVAPAGTTAYTLTADAGQFLFTGQNAEFVITTSELIARKRPRRRRQLPAEIPAEKLPEILEQVSEEKDYLNEALAAAHTELTLAALSTDNAERRTQKLRKLGTDIALLEMELAEAEDEEAFLILVLQAARVLIQED